MISASNAQRAVMPLDYTPQPQHRSSRFWENASDAEVMEAIKAGNRTAFNEIVNRYLGRVVGLAARMLGSRLDAEDVAQEAFIRVWTFARRWNALENGRGNSIHAWLYRIVVNLVIDRKRQRVLVSSENLTEFADETPDSFSQTYGREIMGPISKAIQNLPPRQRTALVLCFFEGHSNIEASEMMSVSVSAIETLLVRARRTLRDALKDEYSNLLKG